jgi:hypothetical protein
MERENSLIEIINEKTVENTLQRQVTLSLERQLLLLQALTFKKTLGSTPQLSAPATSSSANLDIVPSFKKAKSLKRSRDDEHGLFSLKANLYLKNPVGVVKVYSKNHVGLFVLSNDLRNNLPKMANIRAFLGIHFFECPDWDQFKEWSSHTMGECINVRVRGGYWISHSLCRDIQACNPELAGRLEAILAE